MNTSPPKLSWILRLGLSVLIGILVFGIIWISSKFRYPPGISFIALLWLLLIYLTLEVVVYTQKRLTKEFSNSKRNKDLNVTLISIAAGTITYFIGFYIFKWIDHLLHGSEPPFLQHMLLALLIGLVLSLIFGFVQLGMNWRGQYYKSQLENELFKNEIAQSNLSILKNQLDPHFMFNNFNTLYYLIDEDSKLAQKFLKNISTVYRYILQNNDSELVLAKEEFEMAKQYLEVIQQRYVGLLNLEDNIAPDTFENKQVPPLVLQQLIENAVKHNRIDKDLPLSISFSTDNEYLTIKNNKNLKKVAETSKTGLINIAKRYKYLTDKEVIILDKPEEFSVSIPLIHSHG